MRFLFGAFSLAGIAGVLISIGLFRARNSARIATLVLGALVAFFSAIGVLAACVALFGFLSLGLGIEIPTTKGGYYFSLLLIYALIFGLALWWIILFSRKSVAAQFSSNTDPSAPSSIKKPACPPPIALLGWLMILTAALSALSWPLIFAKIPAMLFTHVFSLETSKWIWAANILLFLVCGIGLLKLQRWSYTSTIVIHAFWLVSLFVSQLSPQFPTYLANCYATLQLDQTATYFIHFNFPLWVSAIFTAIPTILLIAGLFYYRPSFLKAVADSRHLSS